MGRAANHPASDLLQWGSAACTARTQSARWGTRCTARDLMQQSSAACTASHFTVWATDSAAGNLLQQSSTACTACWLAAQATSCAANPQQGGAACDAAPAANVQAGPTTVQQVSCDRAVLPAQPPQCGWNIRSSASVAMRQGVPACTALLQVTATSQSPRYAQGASAQPPE